MTTKRSIQLTRDIKASPEMIFEMLTEAGGLREWFCVGAYTEPHPGGHLQIRWRSGDVAYGTYTRVVPLTKVSFTWAVIGQPGENTIRVGVRPGRRGTRVTLVHSGITRARDVAGIEQQWGAALDNLQSVLETGIDQRDAQLPRIGLGFESPRESKGVAVMAVAPGGPAALAGLQKEDILVNFNGHRIELVPDFMHAFLRCRAGQSVRVVYVRGGKRASTTIELGSRSLPELPADLDTLLDQAERAHVQAITELKDCMQGIDDEAARKAPAPGEWSVQQAVGHLCASERAFHAWVADTLQGRETGWIEARMPEQLAAVSATAPTLGAMVNLFECQLMESRAMVAALTPEHLTYKMRYRRIAHMLIEFADHTQEHIQQIKATLNAVQGRA